MKDHLRNQTIRLASSFPTGSDERRALLSALEMTSKVSKLPTVIVDRDKHTVTLRWKDDTLGEFDLKGAQKSTARFVSKINRKSKGLFKLVSQRLHGEQEYRVLLQVVGGDMYTAIRTLQKTKAVVHMGYGQDFSKSMVQFLDRQG